MSEMPDDEVWLDLSDPDIRRALRGRPDHEFVGVSPSDLYAQTVRYIRADLYEQAEAELAENEGVINVWRGRTERAEAARDRLRAALERLMRGEGGVNSLEQERIAQEALDHD